MIVILAFLIAHWYLSLFTQSFFHHRYAAHQQFTMSKGWEKFFFIFSFFSMGSSYMSPYAYGVLHRQHHSYTDVEGDPHSPYIQSNFWTMMLSTFHRFNEVRDGKDDYNPKFRVNLPEWTRFDNFASRWPVKLGWGVVYFAIYWFFAPHWAWFLLLPVHFVMGPIHGAIVNWFAHRFGYRNYDCDNHSRNLMPFDIFMMGEGYHNNHHAQANSPSFAHKWYEIDPVYPVILALNKMKVIRLTAQTS